MLKNPRFKNFQRQGAPPLINNGFVIPFLSLDFRPVANIHFVIIDHPRHVLHANETQLGLTNSSTVFAVVQSTITMSSGFEGCGGQR